MKRSKFKLYHITNAIFLDSIKEFGLGAKDPVKENNLLLILSSIFDLCEQKLPANEILKSNRDVTINMINQNNSTFKNPMTQTFELQNFTHGKLYLSANEIVSAIYGLCTKYGSEILTRIIMYMKLLGRHNIEYNISEFQNMLDFKRLIISRPKIIMIKFDYFDGLILEFEDRFDKLKNEKAYSDIEYFNKRISDPNFASKLHFRTSGIVPARLLKFYELRVYNEPNEDFDYSLIKI